MGGGPGPREVLRPREPRVLLDELDRELERRGHRFVRYADDSNVYVRSKAAGERVMASLERFLGTRLRLKVNRDKSAVARPWERKSLGYSVTSHREPRLRVAAEPVLRGWVAYFRMAEVKASFEELRRRGLDGARAATSAHNGHGPWWNAGASHMNHAVPSHALRRLGLVSLLDEHRRLACTS